jgi:hypothetical protein
MATVQLTTYIAFRKKSTFHPQLSRKSAFPPSTPKPGKSPPSTFQTVHFTSWSGFEGGFTTVNGGFATVGRFCLCLFLFISAESLKNHIKSQKNHKMKNLILLHST